MKEANSFRKVLGVLICINFCFKQVFTQFPRRCVDKKSLESRECCPVGPDGVKCGESLNRGSCKAIETLSLNKSAEDTFQFLLDDRAWWPRAFYDRACKCRGNFYGVDCSTCKHGYEGDSCDFKSKPLVRRSLTSLSINEIERFIDIVDQSKHVISENYVILTNSYDRILQGEFPLFANSTIYDIFVWMHYYSTKDNLVFEESNLTSQLVNSTSITENNRDEIASNLLRRDVGLRFSQDVDYAHEGPAFLPWHRYFMLLWENEIRKFVAKNPNFSLPYWDWRDKAACNICDDLMFGGRNFENETLLSSRSPFYNWETVCTKRNEYVTQGLQCTGKGEGSIIRNPGNFDPNKIAGLPTTTEVFNMLELDTKYDAPNFDDSANSSFRNILEGFANPNTGVADTEKSFLHNAVHLFMNGTMSSVDTSANDPIFLVHHVFVDSLYEKWLRKNRVNEGEFFQENLSGIRLGHRPNDNMVPFFPLTPNKAGFQISHDLGYVYDYMLENETGVEFEDTSTDSQLDPLGSSEGSGVENSQFTPEYKNSNSSSQAYQISILERTRPLVFNGNQNTKIIPSKKQRKNKKRGRHGKQWQRWNDHRFNEGKFRKNVGSNLTFNSLTKEDILEGSQPNAWESLKEGLTGVNRALSALSVDEVAWLIVACGLLIGCAVICVCICRPRSHRFKQKSCCCRCRNSYDEEEYYALLDATKKIPP